MKIPRTADEDRSVGGHPVVGHTGRITYRFTNCPQSRPPNRFHLEERVYSLDQLKSSVAHPVLFIRLLWRSGLLCSPSSAYRVTKVELRSHCWPAQHQKLDSSIRLYTQIFSATRRSHWPDEGCCSPALADCYDPRAACVELRKSDVLGKSPHLRALPPTDTI